MSNNSSSKIEIIKQPSFIGVSLISVLLIVLSIPVILTLARYDKCKDQSDENPGVVAGAGEPAGDLEGVAAATGLDENTKRTLQYLRYSLTIITTILVTTIARAVGKKYDLLIIAFLSGLIGLINYFISFSLLKKEKCSSVKDSDKKFMTFLSQLNLSLIILVGGGLFYLTKNRKILQNI